MASQEGGSENSEFRITVLLHYEGLGMNEKRKEPLVTYSVRLTQDQVGFLKNIEDAAGFIREALDVAILAYSNKPKEHRVVALNRRISQLQKQIVKIKETEEYREIMARWNDESMVEFGKRLEKCERLYPLSREIGKLRPESRGPVIRLQDYFAGSQEGSVAKPEPELKQRYKVYDPSNPVLYINVEASTPDEALEKAEREIEEALAVENELEKKKEYEFLEKTKEAYEETVRTLEKEIEEIKSKVIQ